MFLQFHMRNIWKKASDATRCDNTAAPAPVTPAGNPGPASALISQPTGRQIVGGVPLVSATVFATVVARPPPAAITQPASLANLARRPATTWEQERAARTYVVHSTAINAGPARCMTAVQNDWDEYLKHTRSLCSKEFWFIFLRLHTCSINAIDSALNAVKKMYVRDKKRFPISRRALLEKMKSRDTFWSQVLHTHEVDVSQFQLPSGTESVTFKFVDPVWGWIMAARQQHPEEMHWRPVAQVHGREVYGGGIQYGKFFRQACHSVPAGSYPMCVGLHWDGTEARGLSSAPICICVGNTNSCDRSAQFCIGYVPHVPDQHRPEWKKLPASTNIKFFIRQQCCKAILRVLEEGAKRGVICRLPNQHYEEVERLLYPRLSSMNFDQPEAQLFFGAQNNKACSKCRRRKGYSAFRHGTLQQYDDIRRLYVLANDSRSVHKQSARETLKRWGFNYQRQCCLLTCCPTLLVRIPGLNEVFPCVDYRDRMHGAVIFLHRMFYTTLVKVVTSAAHKRMLDERLAAVCRRGYRTNGTTFRSQRTVFKEANMTAGDRSCVLFMLSHVLGTGDDTFWPPGMLLSLSTALAHIQLVLVALRGRRLYTVPELKRIFDRGYVIIFGSLEAVHEIHYNNGVRKALEASEPPPKRHRREPRYPNPNPSLIHFG